MRVARPHTAIGDVTWPSSVASDVHIAREAVGVPLLARPKPMRTGLVTLRLSIL